jgi:hypothetical protein
MHEYDVTMKSVLTRLPVSSLAELTGFAIERWHNVELPVVRHRRADLLGETADGSLVHVELQSTNHRRMAKRMLEYSLAIDRKFGRFPEQVVLYVGSAPMRMQPFLTGPGLSYECTMLDIREFDAEPLLESDCLEENVVSILMRLGNEREAVRRILKRIAATEPAEREAALGELMVLAGLRTLGTTIEEEIQQMPILDDIMDHEVIGRERKRGIALGERLVILRLVGKRFGPVPDWAKQRLDELTGADLEQVELRLLDAASLEELLG